MRLSGDLDWFRVAEAREEILAAVQGGSSEIEIDCAELTSIGPEGVRMLLHLGEELGKLVVLTGMTNDCRQRIRVMGLEEAFEYR